MPKNVLLAAALLSFFIAILLGELSGATEVNVQGLVSPGIVGRVSTDYKLSRYNLEPQLVEIPLDYIDEIDRAIQELSAIPEDTPIAFPVGTNHPIRIGDIPNDDGSLAEVDGAELVGFVDNTGQPKTFTTGDAISILRISISNGNRVTNCETQFMIVADATGSFLQARRVPVFNIIVQRRGQRFVVPNVNAYAVLRDLINAVLNGSLKRI